MVKIGLISDSHGHIDEKVLGHLQDVDEIWHAGDIGNIDLQGILPKHKKWRIVYGNIDDLSCRKTYEEELFFEIEGLSVLLLHIGGKPPRYAKGIKKKLENYRPGIFVCGHSHICKVEFDPKLKCLYMNPGAIGQQGFHPIRTMLKFEIDNGKLANLMVVELGRRGVF